MRALPRKVDRQTLVTILDYLEASEKILMDGGSITWLFTNNPKLIQLVKESPVLKPRNTRSSRCA